MTIFYFIYFALFGVLGTLLALGVIDIKNKIWLFMAIHWYLLHLGNRGS